MNAKWIRTAASAWVLVLAIGIPAATGAGNPASPKEQAKAAMDKAVAFLKAQQKPDGSIGAKPHVGITSLAIAALVEAGAKESAKEVIEKAVAFILASQQKEGPDKGAIFDPKMGYANYNTSVAIMALVAVDKEKYKDAIAAARDYEIGIQRTDGAYNGAIGYGSNKENPDLSNLAFAVLALHDAGVGADADVMKRAAEFISRVQNRAESNDMARFKMKTKDGTDIVPGADGGMGYSVGDSKSGLTANPDGTKSPIAYAGMTYQGLLAFLYAGVNKDDPRVQGAMNWIKANWTLDENAGLRGEKPEAALQGLFYYYRAFAKALDAYGEVAITDKDGKKHLWARELVSKLSSLQKEDGSWANAADRWQEGDATLVTSYALHALGIANRWLDKE